MSGSQSHLLKQRSFNGLLFLPMLQLPVDQERLERAYRDAVEQAVYAVTPPSANQEVLVSRLDIALLFDGGSDTNRTQLFSSFQSLIAELYSLVCISASEKSIELDFPGGVDIRIFALDTPYGGSDGRPPAQLVEKAALSGPLSSMASFVASSLSYDYLLRPLQKGAVDDELRDRDTYDFWKSRTNKHIVEKVEIPPWSDGAALYKTVTPKALSEHSSRTHSKVAVGGTFDHLHIGHKLLLTATIFVAQPGPEDREITVGITGDELLVKKKHAGVLECWDTRQQRTADFVESILIFHPDVPSIRHIERIDNPGPNGKVVKIVYSPQTGGTGKVTINYTQISDPFGPTITDKDISALVISAETRAGGKAVNDKRAEKGWAPLEIFEVDVLDAGRRVEMRDQIPTSAAASFENKISSTEIRRRLAAGEGQAPT